MLAFAAQFSGVLVAGTDNNRMIQNPVTDDAIRAALDSVLTSSELPALGGAIVTSNGLVGIAAVGTRKRGVDAPVTTADEWHLGSDTKAMTAVIAAKLVEQKKLNWNSTLGAIFPALAGESPSDFASITLLQLLSHHSGLPENINWHQSIFTGPLIEQRRRVVEQASKVKLLSTPGSQFQYSNLGYVIVGAIEEQVTGRPWEDLVTEIIFKPLGMSSAGFGGTGTPGKLDQPWGHTADGKPVATNGSMTDNPPVMGPAGRVHCSLRDWGKFIADQLGGELGEPALLTQESYKKLHEPPYGGDYALGWLVAQRPWGGGTVYTHAGSNTMNYAVAWVAPKRDFAVLVTSNQGGPAAVKGCDEAAAALIRLLLKK